MGFLSSLSGALGGLMTGGPMGAAMGGIGGLLGGGGLGGVGGLGGGGGLYSTLSPPPSGPPPVTLTGPEFTKPALALAHSSKPKSIQMLAVYPGNGSPMLATLVPALTTLKNVLAPSATVILYVQPTQVNAALLGKLAAAAGVPVNLPPDPLVSQLAAQQQQMLDQMQQQNMQNFMFQQQMNQESQKFTTLGTAQKSMHDAIMAMLNNAK